MAVHSVSVTRHCQIIFLSLTIALALADPALSFVHEIEKKYLTVVRDCDWYEGQECRMSITVRPSKPSLAGSAGKLVKKSI